MSTSLVPRLDVDDHDGAEESLRTFVRYLGHRDGSPLEIAILGQVERPRAVLSAHCATTDELVYAASSAEGRERAVGVYVLPNSVDLKERKPSSLWRPQKKGESTTNADILSRRVVYIDIDASRPSGTSATEAELLATHQAASRIYLELAAVLGSQHLGIGHSGNGASLFVALEANTPHSKETTAVIRRFLRVVDALFGSEAVAIDTSVSDAKRLVPAFGTLKRKGPADDRERPHRRTAFSCSEDVARLPFADFVGLVELFEHRAGPPKKARTRKSGKKHGDGASQAGKASDATFDVAVAKWNADHPLDLPVSNGECPTCRHDRCFGQLAENEDRWSCFSARHHVDSGGCGLEGDACWHGDALDLEAHARGTSRRTVLLTDGYFGEGPLIKIRASAEIVTEVEHALLAANDGLFVRGQMLTHIVRGPSSPDVTRSGSAPIAARVRINNLRERCDRAAQFMAVNKDGELEKKLPPEWCMKMLAERGQWLFPVLAGVTETPVFRPDGSIASAAGYDTATGYLIEPRGLLPTIPEEPTADDAVRALKALVDPFTDFPFVDESDLAAAVSVPLTIIARAAIDGPTPGYLIGSTTPGSGKGLAADALSMIGTGYVPARMAMPERDEEWQKQILAIAIAGDPVALIDNVKGALGSPSLASALTATCWRGRFLGKTKMVTAPLTAVWLATGNNVMLRADLARRIVPIDLNPELEHPEDRRGFKYPELLVHVGEQRGALVAAALTILRAYHCAGRPRHGVARMGSFESWDDLIRGAVIWAGNLVDELLGKPVQMLDPLGGVKRIRERGDADTEVARAVLCEWIAAFGSDPTTVATAVAKTEQRQALRVALMGIQRRGTLNPDPIMIGRGIAHLEGRIVGGFRFVRDLGKTGGAVRWIAEELQTRSSSAGSLQVGRRVQATSMNGAK